VVGLVDTGINPYHVDFRDGSAEAQLHPSTYLEGYPTEAVALHLSLDEPDWWAAVLRDCEVWLGIEPETLYWIPGTRIVGVYVHPDWGESAKQCERDALPNVVLDAAFPHGAGAAARAAGRTNSLCPDCKVVMIQSGATTAAMRWTAEQRWIDLQSNSWADFVPFDTLFGRGSPQDARAAAAQQVTFAASANGIRVWTPLLGQFPAAGVGIPTYGASAQGPPGVLVVGGHDNGEFLLWPGTMPHVVADSWGHLSAVWNATEGNTTFGGTSGSTPFAAGTFARILLEARRMVGDPGTGLRGGDLVVAAERAALPAAGPLADGRLSRAEAERLFLATAEPRPREDAPHDGDFGCKPPDCLPPDRVEPVFGYLNTYVPWAAVPEEVPTYYFIGYGQVGTRSLESALAVLRGEADTSPRPAEDVFFAADEQVRETTQLAP
jgi:hypothetical protein